MSVLRILDHTGDTEVMWDVDNEVTLEAARKTFEDMIKAGYIAYAIQNAPEVQAPEKPRRAVRTILYEFQENAEEILMTEYLRGG